MSRRIQFMRVPPIDPELERLIGETRKKIEAAFSPAKGGLTTTAGPAGRRNEIIQRVLQRCKRDENGCLVWQGPTSGDGRGGGYGRMSINSQTVAVHRVVFTHYHGYIPGNRHVDHTCGNRLCCNPDHLELVTQSENEKRKLKRRSPCKDPSSS